MYLLLLTSCSVEPGVGVFRNFGECGVPRKSLLRVQVLHLLGKAQGRLVEGRVPPAPGDVASLWDRAVPVWSPHVGQSGPLHATS